MEDPEFLVEDDIIGRINFDGFFDEFPDGTNIFSIELPVFTESSSADAFLNPSPDSGSSWIDDIETLLMKDDDDRIVAEEPTKEFCDSFLADIIVDDSPGEESSGADKDSSDCSDHGNGNCDKVKFSKDKHGDGQDDADDPLSKKRKRYQ